MRKAIGLCTIIIFLSLPVIALPDNFSPTPIDTDWSQLPVILSRIQAPIFPNRDFNIVSFGAPTNGTTIATTFIQKAIDSCSAAGGGRVIVPAGTFLTGALTLKSNVNLHISAGATLKFSTNTADYLPVVLTRFEGIECYNYSPFIYSYGAQNIALTGSGTLNGQASNSNWWAWKTSAQATLDDTLLNQEGQNGTPVSQRVFGNGHQLRPVFVQFYNSQNILIDSITIINSPMYELNPVLSQNLTIQNVIINSLGPNNDGCDPECCYDALINNCNFSTGDDCIAVKSGRNNDGRRVGVPSQYIVIQNCTMQNGHGGVTLGSECSGGINNVYAQYCNMSSPNLSSILRFKTNSVRGGIIENIFMRDCTIGQVAGDILNVDMYYEEGDIGTFTPIIRNVAIDSCNSSKSVDVFYVNAYQRSPLTDIKINGCNFSNAVTLGATFNNLCRLQVYNTLVNGSVPLIPAPVAGFTEAETYSNKLSWGLSNVTTGYNGNGYMEFADSINYIEWMVTKFQNENDTINIRYANADTVTKPCSILINGTNEGQLIFSPTQSTWVTIKKNIPLYKGNNTIRLVSLSNEPGTYIDRFSLVTGAAFTQSDTITLCTGDNIFFNSGNHGNYIWQWQVDNGNGYTNITNDSIYNGTNADTLYLSNPPTNLYGNKYRCSVVIAGDTIYSKEYTIKFANTWMGAVNTAWENTANWNCGNLPDSNTDVIISSGSPYYPVVNNSTSCRSIHLSPPATVSVQPNVSLLLTGKNN